MKPKLKTFRRRHAFGSRRGMEYRFGLTLLELMLVMAIMVVIAALAIPAVQRTFSNQALQKSGDRVRVAMGQARVRAIKQGEEFAVFFVPGGSWFNVAPFAQIKEQSNIADRRQQLADQKRQSNYEDDLLPKGVTFAMGQVSSDARSSETIASSESGGASKLRSILFYPDGTSQDAKLILQNEKGNLIELQLRGLTGIAKSVRFEGNQ